MRAVELIAKKREGLKHSAEEFQFLINSYVQGKIPDYQMSAWLMAVFFQGLDFDETGLLTRTMIDSGDVLDLNGIPGPLVDKHSTGGVGDKISLILAPLAAACGLRVPMMSGRALGHTGGTLDKLDAISGYKTQLSMSKIREGLLSTGFIMTGQSEKVVPADRLLYALRDVSATVESIPLITASILSKKFAEGAQALIFDVKCGNGAFMKSYDQAKALAVSLVETAKSLDRKAVALLTVMDDPLGRMTGNFLEVEESILCLKNQGPEDLMELTYRQTAWMLVAGGLVSSVEKGEALAKQKLQDGTALMKFKENVEFQGGNWEVLESQLEKRRSPFCYEVKAPMDGFIEKINGLECGLAATELGAGRGRKEDIVLPEVGLEFLGKSGDKFSKNQPVVKIWADDEAKGLLCASRIEKSISWNTKKVEKLKTLILEEVTAL